MTNFGYVKYISKGFDGETRNCGYCKTTSDDATHGMWAYQLTCQSYQHLIDRNWRRSGHYCYRPMNDKICCPMYTIRCRAKEFVLRKSHRKVIKNFNNFIMHGIKPKGRSESDQKARSSHPKAPVIQTDDSVDGAVQSSSKPKSGPPKSSGQLKESKKKFGRRERYISKIMKRSNCSREQAMKTLYDKAQARNKSKSLEELLGEHRHCDSPKHRFRTELHLLSENPTEEEYGTVYQVYKKYQIGIHKDEAEEVGFNQFKRFLLNSPLMHSKTGLGPRAGDNIPKVYGSYHLHYYIDDSLVAVGVLDILPNCLSSVYLFYDPEYSFLNLGTYSALNEIGVVRRLSTLLPNLEYYYLGYYIDSCPKMRYKGQYMPSDLLCCETFHWEPMKECLAKLEGKKYSRFSPDDMKDDNEEIDERSTYVIYNRALAKLNQCPRKPHLEGQFEDFRFWARLVGRKAIAETLFLFDTD